MIDRREIKLKAKDLCRNAKPSLITMGMIFTLISIVIGTLSSGVLGRITQQDAERFMSYYSSGNVEKAIMIASKLKPTPTGTLISSLLSVVMWVVNAGFTIFVINTVRKKEEASYGNILDGFEIAFRVILLNLLEAIVVGLMSCLLFVPGLIFSYAYRQALFILIEHPEMSVKECMRESRRMMKGHKWELFMMDLSFLGWYLLSAIVPVAGIYVTPLTETSYFMYYQELNNEDFRDWNV